MTAEKCFVVWNATTDDDEYDDNDSGGLNDTWGVRRRVACPHGWDYDRDPVETSIVTDVSIHRAWKIG